MKSKRRALLLALGGIAATSLGWGFSSSSEVSAGEPLVSQAAYQQMSVGHANVQRPTSVSMPSGNLAPLGIQQVGYFDSGCDSACDCGGGADCGCAVAGYGPELECGCDAEYGCDCDAGCALGGCLADGLAWDLGEPFSLFGQAGAISAGGWAQLGYHSKALPLFNSRPDEFQLHQMWLYAEKSIDTSNGFDFGGRIDYVYGTDSQDTQAFGLDNGHWDTDWDNGPDYGHALPQVYGEAGYGDLSVKVGHFFTIIGYEVVGAPDNFFYSHAYTMYNSEPFTHTGALATWNIGDDITAYGGYTFGWDSGFEDNGDSFLGGVSANLTDHVTVTYATTGGRFNEESAERGYMHSIVTDVTLTDKLQYVGQSDLLTTEDAVGNTIRDTIGYNNYLIYTVNDNLAFGSRMEWWNAEFGGEDFDIYELTLGVNIKPHANVLIRPEIRWDWIDGDTAVLAANNIAGLEDNDDSQTTFGIDTIFLF
ncbi:Putative beta-barrel porin-2, OmpL-like. bbp2 [Neorhodopirellula lusitana]|uniref:Beta-barrel porin-2, OmpL-like. bbp2 n=1 Tax=Neorhodopirellula lusitana TaxID=445327 RepID=A0ABY1PZ15_9BACT|nr:porin [Neorhodopirellula lusitana]SMP51371.1 Putative beta-barrel porin-2, OmpL-like. bbp2 [Neorhodopirellula lusitana]